MAANDRETVSEVVQGFDADSKHHDAWVTKVDRWYRAWRGVIERNSDAAREENNYINGRYAFEIIDTLVGGVSDPNPTWRVKARQRLTSAQQLNDIRVGAKALEILLDAQRDASGMVELQRTHRLQGLIAGMTVWKTRWTFAERAVSKTRDVPGEDDEFGWPTTVSQQYEDMEPTEDDPGLEVVDVRDWIPHEAARDVATMQRCHHRVWMTYDDLEHLQKRGVYKNVTDLKETKSFTDALASRESELFDVDRTKDLIEVVEHWIEGGTRVVTTANRTVLLADRPSPFDHGKFPFVVCGPYPDLFRLQGISTVELVEDLQDMLWALQNHRLAALEFLNNPIFKVREGSTFSSLIFGVGEQWLMDDMGAVDPLVLPTFPAEVTLQAEGLIKADIQNIPGASPALLGQSESTEQTATEISILTNLAQRRLASQKWQFTQADKRVGEHWIELNKQFLTEERYVSVVGEDGKEGWKLIHPDQFAPYEWKIEIDQMDASILKQENLAEAQARFQLALAGAAPMAQAGMPLNFKAFMEDVLRAAGVQDVDRYFSSKPQVQGAAPQQGQQPPGPQPPSGGVTNAPLAAGPMAPSNDTSMSPVANISRMGAMGGGPVNV